MNATPELSEYLAEIRQHVCSRCVERPPGGPPCAPLGKFCGVEIHLAEVIGAVRQVKSDLLAPYLDHNRHVICGTCARRDTHDCPCAMDYLAVLLVEAVEAVDERHAQKSSIV